MKGRLVGGKAFDDKEFAHSGGFLSKKFWEDNIKSMDPSL
jgi:hypothetical protein